MKKSILLIGTLLLVIIGFTACEDDNGDLDTNQKVYGTGDIVTRTLELSSFTSIKHDGVANLYITTGSSQSVVLKAQQNIMDITVCEVQDETLIIGVMNDISIENSKEIRFDIGMPELSGIEMNGVGDCTVSGPSQEDFVIVATGVGDIFAYGLTIDNCQVTTSGVGDIEVSVNETLSVTLTGVGSVYYKGSPEITVTDTGVGGLYDDN